MGSDGVRVSWLVDRIECEVGHLVKDLGNGFRIMARGDVSRIARMCEELEEELARDDWSVSGDVERSEVA